MKYLRIFFQRLNRPNTSLGWPAEILIAIPRLVCGVLLATDFGAAKFGMPWSPADRNLGLFEVAYWFPKDVADYGGIFALFPIFFAWMGAFSEAVGGIFFALGFQTRIASFLIACTMLVAVFVQQWDNGLWGMLAGIGFLWVAMYHLALGSGKTGIDYLLCVRRGKQATKPR